jgi:pimeloyl-ACP methyl ester carboxylesterase
MLAAAQGDFMSDPSPLILVHGAWHGAWCWYKVLPRLRALGHWTLAVDLPGHGRDQTSPAEVGLESYVDCVSRALEAAPAGRATLVGHSMGGLVISGVAERHPERVERLVYLCAVLPVSGDTLMGLKTSEEVAGLLEPSADGTTLGMRPDGVREAFYQDCSDEDFALAEACLCPQPTRAATDPVTLTPDRFGRVPRAYVECVQDRAIEIETQRAMQAHTPCEQVCRLDAGHSPFFSQPDELARALHRCCGA